MLVPLTVSDWRFNIRLQNVSKRMDKSHLCGHTRTPAQGKVTSINKTHCVVLVTAGMHAHLHEGEKYCIVL